MKTIITLLFIILNGVQAMSQSQRIVLAEDFSSAYCPPSAPANIYFNSLINLNSSKVVKLTYQWNFGPDPMYLQNQAQLNARSYYYNVSLVPYALMNSIEANNLCSSYSGSPYCWSQTKIDSAYAIPAAFDIILSHSNNTANDSIFINAVITCTQNITMTTPKFRCAMVEEEIHFLTAPGTNGEIDFFDIVRKMYPDANGTALTTSWIAGQTQTIAFAEKIPAYIYNVNQIGVVAFIQDDANKIVEQAANSIPIINTGIDEPSAKLNLSVYPNPFSNRTMVSFFSEIKKGELKVFDITGRQRLKIIFSGKQIEINRRNLPSGIYFLEASDGENIVTEKLIIQ